MDDTKMDDHLESTKFLVWKYYTNQNFQFSRNFDKLQLCLTQNVTGCCRRVHKKSSMPMVSGAETWSDDIAGTKHDVYDLLW